MGMFCMGPVTIGGCAKAPENGFPPSTLVSLHTTFFIPWLGLTQGPS